MTGDGKKTIYVGNGRDTVQAGVGDHNMREKWIYFPLNTACILTADVTPVR